MAYILCYIYGVQATATAFNATNLTGGHSHGPGTYSKVFDSRKRRVRGLWERNGSFYAQLRVADPATGRTSAKRVRLEDENGQPFTTAGEAVKAMNRLRVRREEDKLTLQPKRSPTFEEYAQGYLDHYRLVKDAKRPATLRTEAACLRRWREHFGPELRVRQIGKAHVNGFMAWRQSQGVSARTVNLELVALRNVLRKAVDDGYLASLPIEGVKWLKHRTQKRRLLSHAEIEKVCESALEVSQNGRELRTPRSPK